MLYTRSLVTLTVVIILGSAACGEDQRNGPPTIIQTRLTTVPDAEDSPLGHVALRIEAWVDDPSEDIEQVYIADSTADIYDGETASALPVDLGLLGEERLGSDGPLQHEHWSADFEAAAADVDGIEIVVVAQDTVENLVTKRVHLDAGDANGRSPTKPPVYYPLTVGNWWTYEDRKGGDGFTMRVSSTRKAGGYTWYVLNEGPGEQLLRVTSRGDIITRYDFVGDTVYNQLILDADRPARKSWRSEGLVIGFLGSVSVEWTYYRVESRHASVITPLGTYTGLQVDMTPDRDFRGGILSVWYADGVGRVRIRGYASDLRQHDYVLVDYHMQ